MPFDPAFASIFPRTTSVRDGRMSISGCDAQELTLRFGSPLYVFDEREVRETCHEYPEAFNSPYAHTEITYPSQAYLSPRMRGVARAERRGVDQRLGGVELVGLHCHLGSPLFSLEPYDEANDVMLRFAAEMRSKHGFAMREYSPGGGFASQYVRETRAPPVDDYAEAIVSSFLRRREEHNLPLP